MIFTGLGGSQPWFVSLTQASIVQQVSANPLDENGEEYDEATGTQEVPEVAPQDPGVPVPTPTPTPVPTPTPTPAPTLVSVTFNYGGSRGSSTVSVVQGQSLGAQFPGSPGAGFLRWEDSSGATFTAGTIVNSNMSVNAVWEQAPVVPPVTPPVTPPVSPPVVEQPLVTVTFNYQDSRAPITRNVTSGQSLGLSFPPNPGVNFTRWQDGQGNTFTSSTIVNANMSVYAIYRQGGGGFVAPARPGYTVNFNLNGGTINNNSGNIYFIILEGNTIANTPGVNFPPNPTRPGAAFMGWQNQWGGQFNSGTAVHSNLSIVAQWNTAGVYVTFNLNGGVIGNNTSNVSVMATQGQSIGSTSVSMPQNPTRAGYTFGGWRMQNGQNFNSNTIVHRNTVVTAHWTPNYQHQQLTITFNPQGGVWQDGTTGNVIRHLGTGKSIRTSNNSSLANFIPTISRPGYTLDGWQIASTTNLLTENTVLNSNMTINARWVAAPQLPVATTPPASASVLPSPPVPTRASVVSQVVYLNRVGTISTGGVAVNLPEHFGRFHVNNDGVSVLPARAALSVLFGADPYDPDLFVWYGDINTFVIDPTGHNVRIQVGSQVMYVNGQAVTIMSGQGASSFAYSAYVDPQNNRLFVPVRSLAEAVGFNVRWDSETATVVLTPPAMQ